MRCEQICVYMMIFWEQLKDSLFQQFKKMNLFCFLCRLPFS